MRKVILYCVLQFSYLACFSQTDSATFNVEEFLQIVRLHHPVLKLANIDIKKSENNIQISRGAFNPIIGNYITNKTFDNTNYYTYQNPTITLPTWYGIEVNAGVENLSGNRFDPSETVGKSSYLGFNLPLLKNLVMDKRRAYLKQSKLYNEMALLEQKLVLNDILQDAMVQYWEWVNMYQGYKIILKNYQNSKQRFEFVKQTYNNGERPAIDTIEAMTQYQSFEFQKNESWLQFLNKGIELSAFLWLENNTPYQLPSTVVPQAGWENEANIQNSNLILADLLVTAQQNHPELLLYNQKFQILEIDRKLKFQELLPKVDFRYNHLSKGYNFLTTNGLLFQNNFQYGLKVDMPIPFSQGRGEYKNAKLKIESTKLMQVQKIQLIDLKVKQYYNEYLYFKNQIVLQSSVLANLKRLLIAEETLFANGESSLFVINSRENKVLETERKFVELKTKFYKSVYSLQWSTGTFK